MLSAIARSQTRIALWLAWAAPFVIYMFSAYRAVGYWDVGEMDTVPWILGIAHPTGFPAYVLSGWLFAHLLPIGSVAFRMSIFSALSMSVAAWLIAKIITEEYDQPWIACASAWIFAFGQVTWTRATRAEVHAPATLGIVATIYCALHWYRTRDTRFFLAGAACWAFAIAVHPVASLIMPGLTVLLIARWRDVRFVPLVSAIALCSAMVVGFYAYLPLRSAYVTAHNIDPTRSIGVPVGGAFWDNDHPSTPEGFRTMISGSEFDVNGGMRSIFTWSVYRDHGLDYASSLFKEFSPFVACFAIFGVVAAFTRDRVRAIALVLCAFASVPFALGYADEADFQRYFLTSFVIAAIFIGEAGVWCAENIRRAALPVAAMLAGFALFLGWSHQDLFRQRTDDSAAKAVATVLSKTPPNAILIASWTYATPLAYSAYVEHRAGDRIVVSSWIDDAMHYLPRWTRMRPVYEVGPLDAYPVQYHLIRVANDPEIYRVERR